MTPSPRSRREIRLNWVCLMLRHSQLRRKKSKQRKTRRSQMERSMTQHTDFATAFVAFCVSFCLTVDLRHKCKLGTAPIFAKTHAYSARCCQETLQGSLTKVRQPVQTDGRPAGVRSEITRKRNYSVRD